MGALEHCLERLLDEHIPPPKDFWGASTGMSLGAGLFFQDIQYPLLDLNTQRFDTVEGSVIVLTHECDISQDNTRDFNEELLICPVTPFADLLKTYVERELEKTFITNLLPALSSNSINRVMYVPPINYGQLPHGGIIYLNQVCSTHISMFEKKNATASLSEVGMRKLDLKLQNHLFRPKSEKLPLSKTFARDKP